MCFGLSELVYCIQTYYTLASSVPPRNFFEYVGEMLAFMFPLVAVMWLPIVLRGKLYQYTYVAEQPIDRQAKI